MFKNNLASILSEKNISVYKLAKDTGISRQTISKIKNDKHHDTSTRILTKIAIYLQITLNDLISFYTTEQYLSELLEKKAFNESNLKLLNNFLNRELKITFKYHPYSNNKSLSVYSKRTHSDYFLSLNIRVYAYEDDLIFDVIDLDFHKLKADLSFTTFLSIYKKVIHGLEMYAYTLGFTKIILNAHPYYDNQLQTILEPKTIIESDLKFLINTFNYSNRENELLKLYIIKKKNYVAMHSLRYKNYEKEKIIRYIDSLTLRNYFEREKLRLKFFKERKITNQNYTKSFSKILNTKIISN